MTHQNNDALVPASISRDPEHLKALEFMEQVCGEEGVDYQWVWDYVQSLWKHQESLYGRFDDKAESILKYLGGGTGLFAIGALAKADATNWYLVALTAPALLFALTAVFIALRIRKPTETTALPTIARAVEYAKDLKDAEKAKAAFLGQWNLFIVDLKLVCERKATLLLWCTRCYFTAIAFLLLPLGVAIFYPPQSPVKSPTIDRTPASAVPTPPTSNQPSPTQPTTPTP